jgi:hypothetical protein
LIAKASAGDCVGAAGWATGTLTDTGTSSMEEMDELIPVLMLLRVVAYGTGI